MVAGLSFALSQPQGVSGSSEKSDVFSVRRVDAPVSGRLADFSVALQGSFLGKGQGPESLSRTGDHCEFGQVFARSVSVSGLSGDQDRVAHFLGFSDSLEDRKVLLNSRRISVLKGTVCEVLEGADGPPRVVDASYSGKSSLHESSSSGSQAKLELSRQLDLDPSSVVVRVVSRKVFRLFTLPTSCSGPTLRTRTEEPRSLISLRWGFGF